MPEHLPTLILIALIALPTAASSKEAERLFEGAPLDDDGRFTNSAGNIGHGKLGDRVPFMLRRFGTYFRSSEDAPRVVANDGAYLRENVATGKPTVTWIGHATLLVQMNNISFLTDPTWSNRPSPIPLIGPKRYVKPGIKIGDLPKIDFVVISHNHYDHLDVPTLKLLAERDAETTFLVPLDNGHLLRKNGTFDLTDEPIAEPPQHFEKVGESYEYKAIETWVLDIGETREF